MYVRLPRDLRGGNLTHFFTRLNTRRNLTHFFTRLSTHKNVSPRTNWPCATTDKTKLFIEQFFKYLLSNILNIY